MEFWIFLENFFKILKQKHFFRKIPINPDFRNHPLFKIKHVFSHFSLVFEFSLLKFFY